MNFTKWAAASLVIGLCASSAGASSLTLTFDGANSGSELNTAPLTTTLGTITVSAGLIGNSDIGTGFALESDETIYGRPTVMEFDFDVSALSFSWDGNGFGVFNAQAFDVTGTLVDSFFVSDTTAVPDGTGSLTAPGIRRFIFGDFPDGGSYASIDDLVISTTPISPVPIPGSLPLIAAGFAALGAVGLRRRGR